MNYNECVDLVKMHQSNGVKKFEVVYSNGTTAQRRLFVNTQYNSLAEYKRRSRGYGFLVEDYPDWISCTPIVDDKLHIMRGNLKKLKSYTDNSGLWPELNKSWSILYKQSDETLNNLINLDYDGKMDLLKSLGITNIEYDPLIGLWNKKCIKSVNYLSEDRTKMRKLVSEAISKQLNGEKEEFHTWWRYGYDNSLSVRGDKGWYSEEYRNCGNGHYYLLLDESHAVHYEDD